MNISLTPRLEEYVRGKVASGLYNNASEVIREALRVLFEREGGNAPDKVREPPKKEELRAKLRALEGPLRQRGLMSMALFGSFLHGDARPDSDVDLLIRISPDTRFSLVDLVSVKNFLEGQLGREVDVVTEDGLDAAIRDDVIREAESVF